MEFTYPGQYITEKGSGVDVPVGVSTAVGTLVGYFPKGNKNELVAVTTYAEFEKKFGSAKETVENSCDIAKGFFSEGGQLLNVIKACHTEIVATYMWNTYKSCRVDALSTGSASNGMTIQTTHKKLAEAVLSASTFTTSNQVVVDSTDDGWIIGQRVYAYTSTVEMNFLGYIKSVAIGSATTALTLTAVCHTAITADASITVFAPGFDMIVTPNVGKTETFLDVSWEGEGSNSYKQKINNVSSLIEVTIEGTTIAGVAVASDNTAWNIGNETAGAFPLTIATQALDAVTSNALVDGTSVTPELSHYTDAVDVIRETTGISMVMLAVPISLVGDEATIYNHAIAIATSEKRFRLIISIPVESEVSTASMITFRESIVSSSYADLWQGLVYVIDETSGTLKPIDPVGHLCGIACRVIMNEGYWVTPAGVHASFVSTTKVSKSLNDVEHGQVNPKSINCIRKIGSYGLLPFGGRTLSNLSDFRYISTRNTFTFVEQTILMNNLWAVFRPNEQRLWSRLKISMDMFLRSEWKKGAFRGASESEAFYCKTGSALTSAYDIETGVVNIAIGIATQKPAEFVHYTIQPIVAVS